MKNLIKFDEECSQNLSNLLIHYHKTVYRINFELRQNWLLLVLGDSCTFLRFFSTLSFSYTREFNNVTPIFC